MKLYVKNMVCDRCIMAVKQLLDQNQIVVRNLRLGEIEIASDTDPEKIRRFKTQLDPIGFELLDDKRSQVVEQIRAHVIRLIRNHPQDVINKKFSVLLSEQMGMDYTHLSSLFSSVEGITLEKYVILQRIEKVKELLLYDELSLNEIAYELGYSSVQHLSGQFKNITGMNPTQFKKSGEKFRKPIDQVGRK